MSKLSLRAILCTGGVFLLAATALVAIRPHDLKANEEAPVVKKRWSIMSPFSRTRITDSASPKNASRNHSRDKVQLVSSEQVVKKQQARKTPKKQARVSKTSRVVKPSLRQSRRTYRPVRRQKKSFLTKAKDFFSSRIPGPRKKTTRKPRTVRYAQSGRQKTRSVKTRARKSGIRFASASNRNTSDPRKTIKKQSSNSKKSEVLTHLEKLYARDGLPMPEMDMKKMAQQRSGIEDPTIDNPFAKIAKEMSKKNLKTNEKGDSKPIYAGPLNDTSQRDAAQNPFAALDRKSDREGKNPFKPSKENTKSNIELVERKKISPLQKHMNSLTNTPQPKIEKETAIGFQGYCPVALRDTRSKIKVNPKQVTVYEGILYSFSSEQARKKFLDNPVRYAPVMGGSDMIRLIEHGQTVEGSLEHCCWFRGRLYMFSGEEMLKTFLDHPSQYATDIAR